MTTPSQDNSFASEMQGYVEISKSALDAAVDWINDNLNPEDVFDESKLEQWAEKNGWDNGQPPL